MCSVILSSESCSLEKNGTSGRVTCEGSAESMDERYLRCYVHVYHNWINIYRIFLFLYTIISSKTINTFCKIKSYFFVYFLISCRLSNRYFGLLCCCDRVIQLYTVYLLVELVKLYLAGKYYPFSPLLFLSDKQILFVLVLSSFS